jgi:hypothetical protein
MSTAEAVGGIPANMAMLDCFRFGICPTCKYETVWKVCPVCDPEKATELGLYVPRW